MSIRSAAFAIALLAAAGFGTAAAAQESLHAYEGPYVSGALGLNFANDTDIIGAADTSVEWENSVMGLGAVGYALGNGLRFEGEFARRQDSADSIGGSAGSGDVTIHSAILNVAYDFDAGWLTPYVGAGIGLGRLASDASPIGGGAARSSDTVTTMQGFIGAAVPLSDQLAFTTDLRYFRANNAQLPLTTGGTIEAEYEATSLLFGLRWNFGAPAPMPKAAPVQAPAPEPAPVAEPAPEPAPAPAPEPAPPRSFLIFFDWDRATIRRDARQILEAAARAYRAGSSVKLDLTGHADRSGPATYNQRLSERRAAAAREVLVGLGIPAADITTTGRGESQPLVATGDGVREPRNRRVEIQF